jgi:hypothetical protein
MMLLQYEMRHRENAMIQKHTHTIDDLRALTDTKSKDSLRVSFNSIRSAIRSQELNREVSVYDVLNRTQRTAYECAFYRDSLNRKTGDCTCEARRLCKHILRAVLLHIARKRALQVSSAQSIN